MKKYAVIVAGGSGQRMGTPLPKQFLLLKGRPVLHYSLDVFLRAYDDMEILLVAPEEHMDTARRIVNGSGFAERVRVIAGGSTRFLSVRNALRVIGQERSAADCVIFVHDGVRCLLSPQLVHSCYEQAVRHGSAIPAIDCGDSVRVLTDTGSRALERKLVKLVQTPQTFLGSILLPAYELEYREEFTDEASVVEAYGNPVHLVEGELRNIKITMPIDLAIAEKWLEQPGSLP